MSSFRTRQQGFDSQAEILFGPRTTCIHNFSQAYISRSCTQLKTHSTQQHDSAMQSNVHRTRPSVFSSTVRLTCPLLVQAIDQLEQSGYIQVLNKQLQLNQSLQNEFKSINARHKRMRSALIGSDGLEELQKYYSDSVLKCIMESGILGLTRVDDVKCLHAHVADELCTGMNVFGRMVLGEIGHAQSGVSQCWQMCDPDHSPADGTWWTHSAKQKQGKLMQRRKLELQHQGKSV